jgi:hypothetical protein
MIPAFTSSSLYFPISASISVLGITPASVSSFALTNTRTRIVGSPFIFSSPAQSGLYYYVERPTAKSTF